jgi:hypothetical protein
MLGEKIGEHQVKSPRSGYCPTLAEVQKWKLRFRRMDRYWAQT